MYCVEVYKREKFDKSTGHAVQMIAMEAFKNKGLLCYQVGQKNLKIDKISPTDKELSNTHFKEGFCTHLVARQHVSVTI